MILLEIGLDDPRPAHLDMALGYAVMRQRFALIVGNPQVDTKHANPLFQLLAHLAIARRRLELRFGTVHDPEGRRLGHTPGVITLDAEFVFEGPDHGFRHSRAADDDAAKILGFA